MLCEQLIDRNCRSLAFRQAIHFSLQGCDAFSMPARRP
jgi:hypothetical protein